MKIITFFVSSTFADMHFERDYLRREVFPHLNEIYNPKNVYIQFIDLRTGIYSYNNENEIAAATKILKVCSSEISRSRPYFIGLIGNRYGSIPNDEAYDLFYKGLENELQENLGSENVNSITDIEIQLELKHKDFSTGHSLFYFRKESSYAGMSPEEYSKYSENDSVKVDRLNALKDFIHASAEGYCFEYALKWVEDDGGNGYFTDEGSKWKKHIIEQLTAIIERESREDSIVKGEFKDDYGHLTSFILNRSLNFISSQESENLLNDFREAQGIHILYGRSGIGKSAMMCYLYNKGARENSILLFHAAGTHPYSDNLFRVLKRWCVQILDETGCNKNEKDKILEEREETEIIKCFKRLVSNCNKRIICILDSLDSMQMVPALESLEFIDEKKMYALLTTTDTSFLNIAEHRKVVVKELLPFSQYAADALLLEKLPESVKKKLLQIKDNDGNFAYESPLWLNLALFVLNSLCIDDFNEINNDKTEKSGEKKLENYLSSIADNFSGDAGELFLYLIDFIFRNAEKELIENILLYLSVSYYGLRELDLAQLIGDKFSNLSFAYLRRFFSFALLESGNEKRWKLSHNIFVEAIKRRRDKDCIRRIHCHIAEYLMSLNYNDPLRLTTSFAHLIDANRENDACNVLLDMQYIEAKIANGFFNELLREMEIAADLNISSTNKEFVAVVQKVLSRNYQYINKHTGCYPQAAFQVLMNISDVKNTISKEYIQRWTEWNDSENRPWLEFMENKESTTLSHNIKLDMLARISGYSFSDSKRFLAYYSKLHFPTGNEKDLSDCYELKVYDTKERVYLALEYPDIQSLCDIPPKNIECPDKYRELYEKYFHYVENELPLIRKRSPIEILDAALNSKHKPLTQAQRREMVEKKRQKRIAEAYKFLGDGWKESYKCGRIWDMLWLNDNVLLASVSGNRVWGWDVTTKRMIINIQLGNIDKNGKIYRWDQISAASLEKIDDRHFAVGDAMCNIHIFEFEKGECRKGVSLTCDRQVIAIRKIDKEHLFISYNNGNSERFNISNNTTSFYPAPKEPYYCNFVAGIELSCNKKYAAVFYESACIAIWDLMSGKLMQLFKSGNALFVGMAWGEDDECLYVSDNEKGSGYIYKISVHSGTREVVKQFPTPVCWLKEYDENNYTIFVKGRIYKMPKSFEIPSIENTDSLLGYSYEFENKVLVATNEGLRMYNVRTSKEIKKKIFNWYELRDFTRLPSIRIIISPDNTKALVIVDESFLLMFDTANLDLMWKQRIIAYRTFFSYDSKLILVDDLKTPEYGRGTIILNSDTGNVEYESNEEHGLDAEDVLSQYNDENPATKKNPPSRIERSDILPRLRNNDVVEVTKGEKILLYSHVRLFALYDCGEETSVLSPNWARPVKVRFRNVK